MKFKKMSTINRVALLIDAGFFIPQFKHTYGKNVNIAFLQKFIDETMQKVQALSHSSETDILFRTYYYDCKPFAEARKDPNGNLVEFGKHAVFQMTTKFQTELRTFPQLALRLGQISFDGWKYDEHTKNYKPDLKQKSVDMKIGLDIAWLSTKRIVDKIVLVTADSDFISPMKYARKEGLQVYLHSMSQQKVKLELREHADFLL
jgi:uncharacterized LabA/DUF88 family protein